MYALQTEEPLLPGHPGLHDLQDPRQCKASPRKFLEYSVGLGLSLDVPSKTIQLISTVYSMQEKVGSH